MADALISRGEQARLDWIDRQHKLANNDFLEALEETGRVIPLAQFAQSDKKFSQTVQMTLDLADRLERNGISAYSDGDPIQIIGAHSEVIYELPNFRQCNMLPMSAQKKRNPTLNMLLYYTQLKGMKNFRHVVLHKDKRCLVEDLPERYRAMKKSFNKWNKHYAFKYGAYFVFYSCEAGSPVKKASEKVRGVRPYILSSAGRRIRQVDAHGRQTWHPHIHALLEMEQFLPKPKFEQMCAEMRHCFGRLEYLFNEPLENTRELCKYMVKCDELMDLTDPDLVAYYHATRGLRTIQTLGGFKEFKKRLKEQGLTIRSVRNHSTGQRELFPMKNWNRSFAGDVHALSDGETLQKNVQETIAERAGPLSRPALISRMAPTNLFCPVAEPAFMVRGRCMDLKEFQARPQVESVIERTEADFLAGWQDFSRETGISLDWWKRQGQLAMTIRPKPETAGKVEDFADFFAAEAAGSGVSAHNTSATGRLPVPLSSGRGKNERSEVPIGPPEAVSSNRSLQTVPEEPPGAAGRSRNGWLDGSPCVLAAGNNESPGGGMPSDHQKTRKKERR